jgi:hypothetical protein
MVFMLPSGGAYGRMGSGLEAWGVMAQLNFHSLEASALLPYRNIGDPLADGVIDAVFRSGEVDAVRQLLRHLVAMDDLPSFGATAAPGLSSEVLAEVNRYLELSQSTLVALEPELVERGEAFFAEHGPEILMILGLYSLPASYTARRGVQVLAQTGRLESHPMRRLIETTQMVVDVMSPGGLRFGSSPDNHGKGVRSAQKVRLMHGAIRRLILERYGEDWVQKFGVPINQMDLAGTLMTFSSVVLDGLRVLGVEPDAEGEAAYLYAWRAIGRLMGIQDELIPRTVADASTLTAVIRTSELGRCQEGIDMTAALVKTLCEQVEPHFLRGIVVSLMHRFLGQYAASIDLPRADWTRFLVSPFIAVSRLIDQVLRGSPLLSWLHRKIALGVVRGLLNLERGPTRPTFDLPDHLADGWRLSRRNP